MVDLQNPKFNLIKLKGIILLSCYGLPAFNRIMFLKQEVEEGGQLLQVFACIPVANEYSPLLHS